MYLSSVGGDCYSLAVIVTMASVQLAFFIEEEVTYEPKLLFLKNKGCRPRTGWSGLLTFYRLCWERK